jgi:hypothetical protein
MTPEVNTDPAFLFALPFVCVACSDQEFWVTLEGRPVWPVRSADDLDALAQICDLLGVGLREVEAMPGAAVATSELVVAINKNVEQAAQLYAHLSNRRVKVITTLADLAQGEFPAVVVTKFEGLTSTILDQLYSFDNQYSAPGLIVADTPDLLRRQVLVRTAAANFHGSLKSTQCHVFPNLESLEEFSSQNLRILGGRATTSALQSAFQCKAGVVSVTTVSDGIDASLAPETILCGMDQISAMASEKFSPRCHTTGHCHRIGIPVGEALLSGKLISPDTIKAGIFVWNACWGLRPPEHVIDPVWSLGNRLLASAVIGAVVTSWQMTITSPDYAMNISEDLAKGISVGEAVAHFNRSEPSRRVQHRMCLLGDPRVALPEQSLAIKKAKKLRPLGRTARYSAFGDVGLLRACIIKVSTELAHQKSILRPAKAAAKAIEHFELTAWLAPSVFGKREPHADVHMRSEVLRFLLRSSRPFFKDWLSFTRTLSADHSPQSCFACGNQPNVTLAHFRIPGVSPRLLSVCSHCSAVSDMQIGSNFGISVARDRYIALAGTWPDQEWQAGVSLWSALPGESIVIDWPKTVNGSPAPSVEIPQPWPVGQLRLSVAIIWRTQVTYFTWLTTS